MGLFPVERWFFWLQECGPSRWQVPSAPQGRPQATEPGALGRPQATEPGALGKPQPAELGAQGRPQANKPEALGRPQGAESGALGRQLVCASSSSVGSPKAPSIDVEGNAQVPTPCSSEAGGRASGHARAVSATLIAEKLSRLVANPPTRDAASELHHRALPSPVTFGIARFAQVKLLLLLVNFFCFS